MESYGETYFDDVREWLIQEGMSSIEFERSYCAYFHIESMNYYFDVAENDDAMNTFWGEDSAFFQYFRKLDLTNVIELACGRGRHVQKYINNAKSITLVDILKKNIDYCKNRYGDGDGKIKYYQNNGYNLEELEQDTYTSLFSYDAMVHFEMFDIYEYLKDMHRVMKKGGMALLHHSNSSDDYQATFRSNKNVHSRSFMSKELFAYLAYKVGFNVVEQRVIDWGGSKNLDCISLIMK